MKCPVDKSNMIVVEYKNIELDYCVQCSGVWFDAGELELLLETMKEKDSGPSPTALLKPVEIRSAEKRRRCPICGQKMRKSTMCEQPRVLIDACPQGEGLWFDGSELGQVVAQVTSKEFDKSASAKVCSFLGDAFKAGGEPEPQK